MNRSRRRPAILGMAAGALFLLISPAFGQLKGLDDLLAQAGGARGASKGDLEIEAQFVAATDSKPARLFITAKVPEGWHTFSVTQPKGGPKATKIVLKESKEFRLLEAQFHSSPHPEKKETKLFSGLDFVEEHEGTVTWHIPIEIAAGVDPKTLKIEGVVNSQRCDAGSTCLPPKKFPFTAVLGPGVDIEEEPEPAESEVFAPKASPRGELGRYQAPMTHALVRGYLTPSTVQPGGKVTLTLRAEPEPAWHVYALASEPSGQISKPTLIVLSETPAQWQASPPATEADVIEAPAVDGGTQRYHEEPVDWTIEIDVPPDAPAGEYGIAGYIGYQTCKERTCTPPKGARFEGFVQVAAEPADAAAQPLAFSPSPYNDVQRLAAGGRAAPPESETAVGAIPPPTPLPPGDGGDPPESAPGPPRSAGGPPAAGVLNAAQLRQFVQLAAQQEESSLPVMLLFAVLGGLILNLMPCVLPVIGLKIMSFVQQIDVAEVETEKQASGDFLFQPTVFRRSQRKVFLLNAWYCLGLMTVFMVLAALAHLLNFGWGELFRYPGFNIVLASVVFVMGLSFLGVWDIPIPGFVGGRTANNLQAKEGPAGAFFKGVLTTVLATPCTGPFLAPALAYAVKQPPLVIYSIFACVGLGMASPYFVLGLFPRLISFLPKPGAWMETFKQIMGFVMFGTVVYLLTIISVERVVPTVALLIGLWLACWWLGRTSLTAGLGVKVRTWCTAAIIVLLSVGVSFGWLNGVVTERFEEKVDQEVAKALKGERGPALVRGGQGMLAWQPYSWQRLDELLKDGNTVLVDFTADWCLTCKTLEKLVLNTPETRQLVDANNVVTLQADWTEERENDDISQMLELLGDKSVPTLAIFPASRPNQPVVIRGTYSKGTLAKLLAEATTKKPAAEATAMRASAPTH